MPFITGLDQRLNAYSIDGEAYGEVRIFNAYGAAVRREWRVVTDENGDISSLRIGGLTVYEDGEYVSEGEI